METALKVRRLCLVDGHSVSEVARRFHLSRNTVRKYLRDEAPPKYSQTQPGQQPQLDAYKDQLTTWIEYDLKRPKREWRTAMRLFECLQGEGYEGAYDSVVRFVRACWEIHLEDLGVTKTRHSRIATEGVLISNLFVNGFNPRLVIHQ